MPSRSWAIFLLICPLRDGISILTLQIAYGAKEERELGHRFGGEEPIAHDPDLLEERADADADASTIAVW